MSKLIEVITLMSSDEETTPEVDTIETKNGKITVKIEETENLKSDHKQFTSKSKNHTLSTTGSRHCSNADSSLNLNLNKVASSNSSSQVDKKLSCMKNNQTARKSFNLSKPQNLLKTKPSEEMHLKKQASCTNVKEKDIVKNIGCENVISCINELEKKGFDHNVIKSKNIPEKSLCLQKRKSEEKSNHEIMLSNCSKKRKLSKDNKQINEFNLDIAKKSDILACPMSLDEVAHVSKTSLPKIDNCERLSVKNSCDNSCSLNTVEVIKYKVKNSISVPQSDINLKTTNASKASKKTSKNFVSNLSNLVIPISSDGVGHLDTGSIQNECSQIKSLTTDNDNSESHFKTSNIGDIKKFEVSNAQISFSNNVSSNNNLIGEFKESDIKVRHCLNDLHPKLRTISKSIEVQGELKKDMSYGNKQFVETNNSNCKNKANLEEDKNPPVYINQNAPLVPSGSTTGKMVEEPGRPIKEVTSPRLSMKGKKMENVNRVLNSINFKKHFKCMSDDTKILSDSKRSLLVVKNNAAEDLQKSNSTGVSTCSFEIQEPQTSLPLPISENDPIPGPSNRTNFTESNKQKFNLLIEFCMSQAKFNSEERMKLQQLMNKKLESLVESFLNSLEFSNRIDTVYEKVKNNPQFVCKLLYDFRKELNVYKEVAEQSSPNDTSSSLQQQNIDASVEESEKKDFMRELNDNKKQEQSNPCDTSLSSQQHNINAHDQLLTKSEKNFGNIRTDTFIHQKDLSVKDLPTQTKALDLNALGTTNENSLNSNLMNSININRLEEMAKKKLDEKITQLEKHLKKLDKKIKKLEAKELTLDDMDDEESSFIQEERYKKKFLKTWNLLCRLKKQSTHVGSQMERKIRCEASRFPEINKKIEKFINKQKVAEKFPDYNKIYDIVKSVNEKVQLGLQESDYSRLAKDLFLDVGSELKRRRINDFEYNITGFIPENFKLEDDPAEKDEDLKVKLENNYEEGKKKLNDIIEEYALKQEEKIVNGEEDVEDDNNVSDEGSEDKNNTIYEGEESGDVSLEIEYREIDSNLPETEPSSPVSGPLSTLEDTKTDAAVVNITADSDASTDPGSKDISSKEQLSNEYKPTAYHSKSNIESDSSSSDLPSL